MKNIVTALVIAASGCPASASEPGQPLDCSDWVFLEPGYSCSQMDPEICGQQPSCHVGESSLTVANDGRVLFLRRGSFVPSTCGILLYRYLVVLAAPDGVESVIAQVDERCSDDAQRKADKMDVDLIPDPDLGRITFDPINGRLYIPHTVRCEQVRSGTTWCESGFYQRYGRFTIEGFAREFDVYQSYTPAAGVIWLRVPAMPEGLAAVDHFDTYWGPLTHPIDFSQAQGLSCNYPATPPDVGDYLEVADTLPRPSPGQGYWYLTSVTYQGQTRFGRKASGGRLSGRDPTQLAECTQP